MQRNKYFMTIFVNYVMNLENFEKLDNDMI